MKRPPRRRIALELAAAALAIGLPRIACAHLVSTGVGPFYDGAAHFFVSFEEILPVLALALLAGLRGPRSARGAIVLLPVAWLIGGLIGLRVATDPATSLTTALLLLVPGAFVAADRTLPYAVVGAAAAAIGFGAGSLNGAAMAAGGAGLLGIFGAASAALIVTILSAAAVLPRRSGWPRVAVRVAGSWLAAVGLLALGWAL